MCQLPSSIQDTDQRTAETMEQPEPIYSNDMNNCMKTLCKECDKEVNLSTVGKHTRAKHGLNLRDYRLRWGEPRQHLVQLVLHTCGLCSQQVQLDHDELGRHLRGHNTSFQEYSREHLVASKTDPYQRRREREVSPPRSNRPVDLFLEGVERRTLSPKISQTSSSESTHKSSPYTSPKSSPKSSLKSLLKSSPKKKLLPRKKKPLLKLRHKLMSVEDSLALSRGRSQALGKMILELEGRQRREGQALGQLVRLVYC